MREAALWSTGEYYQAMVPDTLDLAERAKLSLNHFTSIIDEEHDYEMYWMGIYWADNPNWTHLPRPALRFHCPPLMSSQPKCMEAMAMARIASGSRQGLELEARMAAMLAANIGEEGIYWVPRYAGRPWLGAAAHRPFANVHGQARMMRAMVAWYQYTGDRSWKELVDRMVDGMDGHLVVHQDDYAYFPTHGWLDEEYFSSCYVKGRGWRDTREPADEKDGEEGSLFNHQGHSPGVLANWYLMTGNHQALRLAGELVRFLTKPRFWADTKGGDYPNVMGAEHAHWHGHFYGHINTLRAILEYAIATSDVQLKGFVRDGYEWARQPWLMGRIGFGANGQGCAVPRLIGLAIKLSDEGVGDYWEDVDLYIRNHGTEMQFTAEDLPYLGSFPTRAPRPEQEQDPGRGFALASPSTVLQASLGGFAQGQNKADWALCCSPWGAIGMYYAWDGTLRYADGVARINLLLNHASPWMDIESCLPYEGKVMLRNKQARQALVRIPLWAEKKSVQCRSGGREAATGWFGRYLWLSSLQAGEVITIEFPMQERTERWTLDETLVPEVPGWPGRGTRGFRFRGNTLLEITPPLRNSIPGTGEWVLYRNRQEKYRADQAPVHEVTRYVTPMRLRW